MLVHWSWPNFCVTSTESIGVFLRFGVCCKDMKVMISTQFSPKNGKAPASVPLKYKLSAKDHGAWQAYIWNCSFSKRIEGLRIYTLNINCGHPTHKNDVDFFFVFWHKLNKRQSLVILIFIISSYGLFVLKHLEAGYIVWTICKCFKFGHKWMHITECSIIMLSRKTALFLKAIYSLTWICNGKKVEGTF